MQTRVEVSELEGHEPSAAPGRLWIVRHGQSLGNVARDEAERGGLPTITLPVRDADVPLSPLGQRQSEALGRCFLRLPFPEHPTLIVTSPFVRAESTARILASGLGEGAPRVQTDERLREKDPGVVHGLTREGVQERFPELAAEWSRVGGFYFRPPGGESLCDIIQRLRSFMGTLERASAGSRVLVVTHDAVVLCFRYLLEGLTERAVLDLKQRDPIANGSVTSYVLGDGGPVLQRANDVSALSDEQVPVTTSRDAATPV